MNSNRRHPFPIQSGFTLTEIMVALAIGLLLSLVIIQVSSVFESQKNATTGTSDAQTNGGIALFTISRDLKIAGFPLLPTTNSALECTQLTVGGVAENSHIPTLSPARISEGVASAGVTASDTIVIRYGDSTMAGAPVQLKAAPVANAVAPKMDAPVTSNFGCQVNDTALIINGATCAMTTVKAVPATVSPAPIIITFADADATKTNVTKSTAVSGADFACLGNWTSFTYAVVNGNLQRNGVDIISGIVNIQAQYGIADALPNTDPEFNKIKSWVNASGSTWGSAVGTPTVANRNRIKAVRIAVIARNSKIEPAAVTTACSSTTAAAPTGLCAWAGTVANPAPTIDLSAGDANWARYRYRVFETVIPLRNVIWSKETL